MQDEKGKNKGGRPPVNKKKSKVVPVRCSMEDIKDIREKAALASITVSEYMREMALKGEITTRIRAFPQEVLQLTGTLNHLAANLNQIAKKRNGIEELTMEERKQLSQQSVEVKHLALLIKSYFS
jgi:hypothetical protein